MLEGDEGIGSFEREDAANGAAVGRGRGGGGGGTGPKGEVLVEVAEVAEDADVAGLLHGVVPGALGAGHGPCLGGGRPAGDGAVGVVLDAGDLGGDAEADAGAAHLVEGDGAAAAVGLVALVGLAGAEVGEGLGEVAVPFDRVHGEVEVGIEDEHGKGEWGVAKSEWGSEEGRGRAGWG